MKSMKLIPCEDEKYPDMPDLRFYQAENNYRYFDATYYLSKNINPNYSPSVKDFFEQFRFWVGPVIHGNSLSEEDVCVNGDNGNTYIEEAFSLLFILYVQPWRAMEMLRRLDEMFMYGITIADPLLEFLYQSRFPDKTNV